MTDKLNEAKAQAYNVIRERDECGTRSQVLTNQLAELNLFIAQEEERIKNTPAVPDQNPPSAK